MVVVYLTPTWGNELFLFFLRTIKHRRVESTTRQVISRKLWENGEE